MDTHNFLTFDILNSVIKQFESSLLEAAKEINKNRL